MFSIVSVASQQISMYIPQKRVVRSIQRLLLKSPPSSMGHRWVRLGIRSHISRSFVYPGSPFLLKVRLFFDPSCSSAASLGTIGGREAHILQLYGIAPNYLWSIYCCKGVQLLTSNSSAVLGKINHHLLARDLSLFADPGKYSATSAKVTKSQSRAIPLVKVIDSLLGRDPLLREHSQGIPRH
jgi:hypothetical protein